MKPLNGKWTTKYEHCVGCGTKETRHASKGLCDKCYSIKRRKTPKGKENDERWILLSEVKRRIDSMSNPKGKWFKLKNENKLVKMAGRNGIIEIPFETENLKNQRNVKMLEIYREKYL